MSKPVEKPSAGQALKVAGLILLIIVLFIARHSGDAPLPFGISRDFLTVCVLIIGAPYLIWTISGYFTKPRRKPRAGFLSESAVGEPAQEPITARLEREDQARSRSQNYQLKPYTILVVLIAVVLMAFFKFGVS